MADSLARRVARFGRTVERLLIANREAILDRQYIQERIADAAIALVTSACTLSRWDHSMARDRATPAERSAAELYLRMANRRFDESLRCPEPQRRPPDHRGRARRAAPGHRLSTTGLIRRVDGIALAS